jgi:hypothetical protein
MRSTWVLRIPGYGPTVPGPTLFDPTSIESIAHRWRASKGTFTGLDGTGAASSGDPVGTWTDEIGAVDLVAPSTSARPALITIGRTPVVDFDGTDDALATVVDGIGISLESTIWLVCTYPTTERRIFDTVEGGNVDRMMMNRLDSSHQFYISGRILSSVSTHDPGDWMVPALSANTSTVFAHVDAVQKGTGNESVGSGVRDLRLGSSNTGTSFYPGKIAEVLVFDDDLSTEQLRELQSYAFTAYGDDLGVLAPLDVGDPLNFFSLVDYLDARTLSATLSEGDAVATWATVIEGSLGGTQTVVADRPTYRAAGIGSGPSVELDGVSDNVLWIPALSVTSHTLQFLLELDSIADDQRIVDCSTGRLIVRVRGTTGALEILSGGSGYIDAGVTLSTATPYLLTLRFRGADDQVDVWVNGTSAATNLTYDPVDFRTSTRLGSGVGADREWLTGHIGMAAAYDRALTDTEIGDTYTYVSKAWTLP